MQWLAAANKTYMKTKYPDLADGPIFLCHGCAEAVGLLGPRQLHVAQEPVPGLWAGQVRQRPRAPEEAYTGPA